MELIKEIESGRDKKGRSIKYGVFLCSFCLQEIVRMLRNGLKQKSCGCVKGELISEIKKIASYGENNPFYGKKHTEETRKKQSKAKKGKKLSEEHKLNLQANSKNQLGENNAMFGRYGENNPNYGKKRSEGFKQKLREIRRTKTGILSSNWNNGSSFEPYAPEFNKELKQQILERDNYTCQYPDCKENHKRLHVHHIDYDKKNNNPENLITLGVSCHARTNGKNNRQYWTEFYQQIVEDLNVRRT